MACHGIKITGRWDGGHTPSISIFICVTYVTASSPCRLTKEKKMYIRRRPCHATPLRKEESIYATQLIFLNDRISQPETKLGFRDHQNFHVFSSQHCNSFDTLAHPPYRNKKWLKMNPFNCEDNLLMVQVVQYMLLIAPLELVGEWGMCVMSKPILLKGFGILPRANQSGNAGGISQHCTRGKNATFWTATNNHREILFQVLLHFVG